MFFRFNRRPFSQAGRRGFDPRLPLLESTIWDFRISLVTPFTPFSFLNTPGLGLATAPDDTLIRWHRSGFRLFWKWKSRPRGGPRVPVDVQKLIVEMAMNNPTWGEERIADKLLLKNRSSDFSSDDSALHTQAASASRRPRPALDDFRAEPHQSHHRHGLLSRCDSNAPVGLYVRDHGTRHEANPSL